MMREVFYQGETIPLAIGADDIVELSGHDFMVQVYPHYDSGRIWSIPKASFRLEEADGVKSYRHDIGWAETSEWPTGDYVIEVTVFDGRSVRRVYQITDAFTLKFSNSKKIT